jgi:hypothetical protein
MHARISDVQLDSMHRTLMFADKRLYIEYALSCLCLISMSTSKQAMNMTNTSDEVECLPMTVHDYQSESFENEIVMSRLGNDRSQ